MVGDYGRPETYEQSPPAGYLPDETPTEGTVEAGLTRPPSIPSGESQAPAAVTHFLSILEEYRGWILKAAHPLGTLDSATPVVQNGDDSAVVIYNINWHGDLTGKSYITILRFTLKYDSPTTISSVDIAAEDTNNSPPAFLGSNLMKNMALTYLADKLKERGGQLSSIAVGIFKTNTSVEAALAELLKYLANTA